MRCPRPTWTTAVVLLLLGGAAFGFRRSIVCFVLFHLGRSQACDWADIRYALANQPGQMEARIAESCRRVRADADGYELWETLKGNFWIPANNGPMLPLLLSSVERHFERMGPWHEHPGDIVLDCGAHVGLFVREAVSLGARVVVAIEPAPENVECLKRSFDEEIRAGRVIVYPKGVWDREAVLTFATAPGFTAADRVSLDAQADAGVQSIPVTTIDRLVAELGLRRVDFIKMHVEGSEQQAIAGARETLAKFRPRLAISAHHRDDDAQRIPELVRAAWPDYRMKSGGCHVNVRRLLILPDMLFFSE